MFILPSNTNRAENRQGRDGREGSAVPCHGTNSDGYSSRVTPFGYEMRGSAHRGRYSTYTSLYILEYMCSSIRSPRELSSPTSGQAAEPSAKGCSEPVMGAISLRTHSHLLITYCVYRSRLGLGRITPSPPPQKKKIQQRLRLWLFFISFITVLHIFRVLYL